MNHSRQSAASAFFNSLLGPRRLAQSTVDAFRYVVALDDLEGLKAWLADRPNDAPSLLAMLESPASC
jgi:hypothetical protein